MAPSLSPTADCYVFSGGLPSALTSKKSTVARVFSARDFWQKWCFQTTSIYLILLLRSFKEVSQSFLGISKTGYMQVHQKKCSEPVQSLQHAIRGYPSCSDLWEALGLAYQRLGMFTAALKGAEQFQNALKIVPNNVAAQYGLASPLLGLSQDFIKSGAYFWAASLLEEASEIAKVSTCFGWK